MPHLVFECSSLEMVPASFEERVTLLHQYLAEKLPTDVNNCKSRVYIAHQACLGNQLESAFLHVTVKILKGRSESLLAHIGTYLLQALRQFLREDNKPYENVSIEIVELSPHYFK